MVDFKYNFIQRGGYYTRVKFTVRLGQIKDGKYERSIPVFSKEIVLRGNPAEEEIKLEVLKEVQEYAKSNNQEVFGD